MHIKVRVLQDPEQRPDSVEGVRKGLPEEVTLLTHM